MTGATVGSRAWLRPHRLVALAATASVVIVSSCSAQAPTSAAAHPASSTSAAQVTVQGEGNPQVQAGFDLDRIDRAAVMATIESYVEDRQLNGAGLVLVDRDDGIVAEWYAGPYNRGRVSLVASTSKMVTATVALAQVTDGVLDLDRPIRTQVDWADEAGTITPAALMSSTSGLVGLSPDPAYPPYRCQFEAAGTLAECGREIVETDDDDDDVVPPRTDFRYGGGQWQVLGAVAESVAGQSWAELFDRYVAEPCGLESTGYTNQWAAFGTGFEYPLGGFDGNVADLPVTDNPNLEGGLYTTPADYARLLQLHLGEGRCGDREVVSADLLERAHSDELKRVGVSIGGDRGYGFGWWIDLHDGSVLDPGAYGSQAWMDLERGIAIYLVVEADGAAGAGLFELLRPQLID